MLSEQNILDYVAELKGKSAAANFSETVEEMPLASTSSRTQRRRPVKTGAPAKSFPKNSPDADFLRIFKTNEAIFLIIHIGTNPLRIDLKCDYKLARHLSTHYETVQKSTLLGNKGIEIILTGQIPQDDIKDLIAYSFHHA